MRRCGRRSRQSPKAVAQSPAAQAVTSYIRQHGASFFDELVVGSSLLRTKVEEALSELVALGQVASDSFAGLRALLVPANERKPIDIRSPYRRRRGGNAGMEDAGRWAIAHRARADTVDRDEAIEHVARTLLARYGVVFWRLLEREAPWLPAWRDLLRVYRRLEARGEIRGGRFVAGFSGEQFALPEAVGKLREVRREKDSAELVSLSGADPLNLVGIITPVRNWLRSLEIVSSIAMAFRSRSSRARKCSFSKRSKRKTNGMRAKRFCARPCLVHSVRIFAAQATLKLSVSRDRSCEIKNSPAA
jgi:hypothetical protein